MLDLLHDIRKRLLALRLWLRCRRDKELAGRVNCLLALHQEHSDSVLH